MDANAEAQKQLAAQFYLPLETVKVAWSVFEKYRVLDDAPEQPKQQEEVATTAPHNEELTVGNEDAEVCVDTEDAGVSAAAPGSEEVASPAESAEASAVPPLPLREVSRAPTQDAPTIGVKGLQAFFLDIGFPKSSLEVVDLIGQMCDNTEELLALQKTEESLRQASAEPTSSAKTKKKSRVGGDATASAASFARKPAASAAAAAAAERTESGVERAELSMPVVPQGLTFPHFLFLLQQRLSDEEDAPESKDAEVRDLFTTLDADGDGVLSHADVRSCIETLWATEPELLEDPDLYQLLCMHPTELRAAISECDLNADGKVTVDDLVTILRA